MYHDHAYLRRVGCILDITVMFVQDMLSMVACLFQTLFYLCFMLDSLLLFLVCEYESVWLVIKIMSILVKIKMSQNVLSSTTGLYAIKVIVVAYSFLAYNIVLFKIIFKRILKKYLSQTWLEVRAYVILFAKSKSHTTYLFVGLEQMSSSIFWIFLN